MIRVVSLFSGGGFAEESLRLASLATGVSFKVVMAVDSWEPAARVRDANFEGVRTIVRSVKEMTREDLPSHDLVIGGPPCQDHSLAGKRGCACNVGGIVAERCCLADFVRLASGGAWVMENVRPRLIRDGWSEQFCAANFGDVTSRKRWFYSSHLLHVVPTPGPLRFGDIRDHEADAKTIGRRGASMVAMRSGQSQPTQDKESGTVRDDGYLGSLTQSSFHGHKNNGNGEPTRDSMVQIPAVITHRPRTNSLGCEPYATYVDNAGMMGSITADAAHNTAMPGQSRPTQDKDFVGSLTSGKGGSTGFLKVGLRGHSASASASAFEDDEIIGSLVSNSWHGNEISRLGPGVRCPSLLEMARAHSIPDSWDWAGTTKTQRGQIIANGWPIGMGNAVMVAALLALAAERERAA